MTDTITTEQDPSRKRKIEGNGEEDISDSSPKATKVKVTEEGTAVMNTNINATTVVGVTDNSTNNACQPNVGVVHAAVRTDSGTANLQEGCTPQENGTKVMGVIGTPTEAEIAARDPREQEGTPNQGQAVPTEMPPGVPVGVPQADPRMTDQITATAATISEVPTVTSTSGVPVESVFQTPTVQTQAQPLLVNDEEDILEEKGEVPALFVGRVIGRGGEMIRDLQARSGCRLDVDQNVPIGAPRVISYRGTQKTISFAKQLVQLLCSESGKGMDLPLGNAHKKVLVVPADVIGKIIGRGGETIRELQSVSQGKIQVDHSGAGGIDPAMRQVTLVGTELSVTKADEMIRFLVANPAMDAMAGIAMLIREKSSDQAWGSGPPYTSMPNNGQGMQGVAGHVNSGVYGAADTGYGQTNPTTQYGGGGYTSRGYGLGTETEVYPCDKMYMGRVIGQKGVTINDLQKRCGCNLLINQDVPQGHDCQITIKGPREGIDSAKQMLTEIIQMGPNHPYAGGGRFIPAGYGQQPQQQQPHQQQAQQQFQQAPQQQMSHEYGQSAGYGQQAYGQGHHYQQGQQQYAQQQPGGYAQLPGPGMAGPPPSQWKAAVAPNGHTYYYHAKTGETSWQRPADM